MTREQFLGPERELKPASTGLLAVSHPVKTVSFGKYVIKVGYSGADAYDGNKLVASYHRKKHLFVRHDYRRQGIAAELVYQAAVFCGQPLGRDSMRSEEGQKLFEAVWDRIQAELNSGG